MNQHKKPILLWLLLTFICIFAMSCDSGIPEVTDGNTEPSLPVETSHTATTTEAPAQTTQPAPKEELEYKLNSDGSSYTVIGIGTFGGADLEIPATYEGLPVTAIGNSAFKGNEKLVTVTIGAKNIESSAFEGCKNLKTVILFEGVETIADGSFIYCPLIESITLPKTLQGIATYALHGANNLNHIKYSGTMTEWKNIDKEVYWDSETGKYTITCSDGDIAKVEIEV